MSNVSAAVEPVTSCTTPPFNESVAVAAPPVAETFAMNDDASNVVVDVDNVPRVIVSAAVLAPAVEAFVNVRVPTFRLAATMLHCLSCRCQRLS